MTERKAFKGIPASLVEDEKEEWVAECMMLLYCILVARYRDQGPRRFKVTAVDYVEDLVPVRGALVAPSYLHETDFSISVPSLRFLFNML